MDIAVQQPWTAQQRKDSIRLWQFMTEFHSEHGYAPSTRESSAEFGWSTSRVNRLMDFLEMWGAIETVPTKSRAVNILIPCYGKKD